MPFTSGTSSPEADHWGVDFDMLAPDGANIRCIVTRGALDDLSTGNGSITADEQPVVFDQWRTALEAVASQKFDAWELERGMVVVRPQDVKKRSN
jgi:hypothetical protein